MCGGSPSAPTPPPKLPDAPRVPDIRARSKAKDDTQRRRAAAGESSNSTILTSTRGVQDGAMTAVKTLLGQ